MSLLPVHNKIASEIGHIKKLFSAISILDRSKIESLEGNLPKL